MKHPTANLLVVRRNFNTLRDSCFADLLWGIEKLGCSHLWEPTKSPLELTYKPTGQKILFRGLDDGLKLTSITVPQGSLNFVWVEEAYEITSEDDFNKLDMSIRGEVAKGLWKQVTITFNPWSAQSWLKARFFDTPSDMVYTQTTTFRQNEWLDEADRKLFAEMEKNNPRRFNIEGNGEWGITDGLIYDRVEMRGFDVDALRKVEGIKSAFGLDFGFTDPTHFACALIDNSEMVIYIFDEWRQVGVTNKEIAQRIKSMGYGGQRIVCDSAEPKSIAELRAEGINAEPSQKGADSVLHGIQKLQNYKFVFHPNCIETYKDFCNYCWAKDKFGKPIDKPDHEFSHGPDAVRYGTAKVLASWANPVPRRVDY